MNKKKYKSPQKITQPLKMDHSVNTRDFPLESSASVETSPSQLRPLRGMTYNMPSSTDAHRVYCSYCDHRSYGRVKKINGKDYNKYLNHQCCPWDCNESTCKKCLLIDDQRTSEFYVLEEKYFVCYSCMKTGHFDNMNYRPYWRLPEGAVYVHIPGQFIERTHKGIRSTKAMLFEDLWYDKYWKNLSPSQRQQTKLSRNCKRYVDYRNQSS